MELTSSADVLRVAKNAAKFFVKGLEMTWEQYDTYTDRCFLWAENTIGVQEDDYEPLDVYVRRPNGMALFHNVEELISLLKSGDFQIR